MEEHMKTVIHKANARGAADHGWLDSRHTFSFAGYYNPDRMGFGLLRVINDDVVAPSMGFGTHPHANMEIVSVPLKGSLRHKDTIGNDFVIKKGEIQVMSAGSGIAHSEYNNSPDENVNFLQIWVFPKEPDIAPSYSQKEFSEEGRLNRFQLIVSPRGEDGSSKINQNAYFSLIKLEKGKEAVYSKKDKKNGVYFFIIEGALTIAQTDLTARDGFGVAEINDIGLSAREKSEALVMEVPMDKI